MKKNRIKDGSFDWSRISVKIKTSFLRLSQKLIYMVLLLWYAYKRPETPSWAKNIVIGAITYFLSPIDGIPDLSPFLGFTDDLGVLAFGLVSISCYIDDEIRAKAKNELQKIYSHQIDLSQLAEVDKML